MNGNTFRELRIFIACPGDVAAERDKVHEIAKALEPTAEGYGFKLKVLDWREAVPDAGRGQAVIFKELKPESWDLFIGVLWARFGTPPGGLNPETGKDFDSGTHEEFQVAFDLAGENNGRPRIMMYQCQRAYPFSHDPEQLKKVKDFIKDIQNPTGKFKVLTQSFKTPNQFGKKILHDLQAVLNTIKDQATDSKADFPKNEPAPNDQPEIISNLPKRADFFGREKDLEFVRNAISRDSNEWGVLIDAIGGMGKTALAVEAAYRAMDAGFFKACVFVTAKQNSLDYTGIVEEEADALAADDFINETARIMCKQGIAQMERKEKKNALFALLREIPTLLVYDNLETLEEEQQLAITRLFKYIPEGSKAILTSRRKGAIGGLHLPLHEIDWSAAEQIIENEIAKDEGLGRKLGANKEKWKDLHSETFGSPLALMHIIGLIKNKDSLNYIDAAITLLRSREKDVLKRIDFMFGEAKRIMGSNDLAALYALSYFVPSAEIVAWGAVAKIEEQELNDAIDHLGKLCLLEIIPDTGRYALHPLTREFAQKELDSNSKSANEIGVRFAQYWLDFSAKYGGDETDSYKTFQLIDNEWPNIESATNWLWKKANIIEDSIENKDAGEMLNSFADALILYLLYAGRWDERIGICEWSYQAMQVLKDEYNAGWRAYDVAYTWWNRGKTEEAEKWASKAVAAWKHGESKYEEATGLRMLGMIVEQKKEYTEAEDHYQKALELWREMEDHENMGSVLSNLGSIAFRQKQYDSAEKYYLEAIEKTKDLGDKATYIICLAMLENERMNLQAARKWYDEALKLANATGKLDIIAYSYYGLALLEETGGKAEAALGLAEKALKIREQLQHIDLQITRNLVTRLKKKIAGGWE